MVRCGIPPGQTARAFRYFPLQNPAVRELSDSAHEAEQAGNYAEAAMLLERALRIQPRDPELLQHMAEVKLQEQDYQQALSFASRSYDSGPRVGELCSRNWRTISVARDRLGDAQGSSDAESRAGNCMNTKPKSY